MSQRNSADQKPSLDHVQASFLRIVARIEAHGHVYFRNVRCPGKKDEFLAEMTAISWKWWLRLHQKGKDPGRFVSAIATFAARAVGSGRRLCGQERAKDAMSPVAQKRHDFAVGKLPDFGTLNSNPLSDALTDNTKTPPDEQVAFRIDFPAWLMSLDNRKRRIAEELMLGERTMDVANRFGLSEARISQLRREFMQDWGRFCGDAEIA